MFFLSFSTLLLFFFLWGPLVARADFRFAFRPSPIQQCQPVNISFLAVQPKNFKPPTSLTILPFNAQPISIPVDGASVNSAGIALTFLPVESGVQFIASLDDDEGDNSARVSDVNHVVNETGTDDCLPTPRDAPAPPVPIFAQSLPTSISQCEAFTVDIDAGQSAPNIRAFIPNQGAHMLNVVSTTNTTATYMVDIPHLTTVLLVAFDGDTDAITDGFTGKDVLTVDGDASSDTSCFNIKQNNKGSGNGKNKHSRNRSSTLSSGAIAGIVIGLILFLAVLAIFILYIIRRRNIRKAQDQRALAVSFNPWMLEKRSTLNSWRSPPETVITAEDGFVKNPAYVADLSSRFSMGSVSPEPPTWAPDQPLSPLRYGGGAQLNRELSAKAATSINAHDIEQMLNYTAAATSQSYTGAGAPIANGYSQPYSSDAMVLPTPRSALPTGGSTSFTQLNPFGDFGDNGPLRESPVPMSDNGSMRTHRDSFASFPHGDPDALRSAVGGDSGSEGEDFQIITVTRPQPAITPTRNLGRLNSLPSSVRLASNNSFTSGQLVRVGSATSSRNGSSTQGSYT